MAVIILISNDNKNDIKFYIHMTIYEYKTQRTKHKFFHVFTCRILMALTHSFTKYTTLLSSSSSLSSPSHSYLALVGVHYFRLNSMECVDLLKQRAAFIPHLIAQFALKLNWNKRASERVRWAQWNYVTSVC